MNNPIVLPRSGIVRHFDDGALFEIRRGHKVEKRLRMGPNVVYAYITHPDGSITEIGESHNLLTNIGRDWWADALGGVASAGGMGNPASGISATSLTGTGSVWTASNFATPQLGLAGKVVVAPITNVTTQLVYGLIGSNTNNVLTIDKWWTPDFAGTGTTPSSTTAFDIIPGRGAGAIFMALTTDASAASAASTALTSEATTNGLARAKATYTHTYGAATQTHVNAFSASGTTTAVHRMGLFTCSTLTATGILVFESVLNVDATVASGDTLTVTDTITLS